MQGALSRSTKIYFSLLLKLPNPTHVGGSGRWRGGGGGGGMVAKAYAHMSELLHNCRSWAPQDAPPSIPPSPYPQLPPSPPPPSVLPPPWGLINLGLIQEAPVESCRALLNCSRTLSHLRGSGIKTILDELVCSEEETLGCQFSRETDLPEVSVRLGLDPS